MEAEESSLKVKAVDDDWTPDKSDGLVTIKYLDIDCAAGDGTVPADETETKELVFRRYFLTQMGVSPQCARLVRVRGNSMTPRLHDGDLIAVNTGIRAITDGDIFVIRHEDMLRIKRLYRLPGGGVRLRSDNHEEYPDEILSKEEAERSLTIIGRVFWVGGTL